MFPMKVCLTGAIVFFIAYLAMIIIGNEMPHWLIALPLVVAAYGGLAAAVGGLLWFVLRWVWGWQ